MQHLIELAKRPRSAENADTSRDITVTAEYPSVMIARLRGILEFLELNKPLNCVPRTTPIPDGMPHVFYPHPQALLAAMDKKFSPQEYSAVCLKLLEKYGDGIDDWLRGGLTSSLVKHDPTNLMGWSSYLTSQPEGTLNVYERGFSPITRFKTGDDVYNLPARDGRKPLLHAGATPGGLLEWVLTMALLPGLKSEIIRVYPWVVHPGTKVRRDVNDWSYVSCCVVWYGRAYCDAYWDVVVYPFDALFSLL